MKKFQKNKFSKPKSSTSGIAKAIAGVLCVAAGVTGGYFLGNNVPKSTTANLSQVETNQNDNSRVEELLRQKEELQAQISTKTNQIEELQAQIEELQAQIENAEEIDVESFENQIQELTEEIEGLNSELEELTSELEEMDALLSSVTQDYVMVKYHFDTPIEQKTFTYMLRRDGESTIKQVEKYKDYLFEQGYFVNGFKIDDSNQVLTDDTTLDNLIHSENADSMYNITFTYTNRLPGSYLKYSFTPWDELVSSGRLTIATTENGQSLNGWTGLDLEKMVVPDNISIIGGIGGNNASNKEKVTHVILPDTAIIKSNAFYNFKALKYVNIPSATQTLESWTFLDCAFESIIIPEGVETIEANAIRQCKNLKTITLPNSLTSIGEYGVFDCAIENLTIPKNVANLSVKSFLNNNLEYINVDTENQYYKSIDGILFSKDESQLVLVPSKYENSLIILPEATRTIKGYAMANCQNLNVIWQAPYDTELGAIILESQGLYAARNIKVFAMTSFSSTTQSNSYNVTYYYYSENENTDGNHWHYVNGQPVVWVAVEE